MKSGLVMIAAVLLILQAAETQAANLKYVRTAKHQDFTRIVFEFQNPAQFKEPVIDGKGKFTVVFPDSTTVLPRQILYKKTQIQPVRSIEFIQKGTLLTTGIKLSFPYFKLKAFSLSGPDRVVIDAYLITPPTREVVPEESLHAKPSVKESKGPETKEPKAMPEESSEKELTELVTKQPTVTPEKSPEKESGKPEMTEPKLIPIKSPEKEIGDKLKIKKNDASDITPKRIKKSSKESLNKVPASPITTQIAPGETAKRGQIKPAESLPSTDNNYNLQTYMLALLNFLTIVIILLLSINLLKKKSGINSEHPGKISESLRTVDESIAAIDTMINREFKKHDES
ncbi:MAG: hypothetical protein U9N83_02155 [Thermodesulfobacteriota bacterium]|nr:hypothetical protein [Thermodesulfobacteriota bacterium]